MNELQDRKNVKIPQKVKTRDDMTEAEFDKIMAMGLAQAKTDDSWNVEKTLSSLGMEIAK